MRLIWKYKWKYRLPRFRVAEYQTILDHLRYAGLIDIQKTDDGLKITINPPKQVEDEKYWAKIVKERIEKREDGVVEVKK